MPSHCNSLLEELLLSELTKAGSTAAKRSLCRYLMVETTAAHLSLRQQKSTLANRSSPGQPITTNPSNVYPLLVIRLHSFIKQTGNRADLILRLSLEKPCYNSCPLNMIKSLISIGILFSVCFTAMAESACPATNVSSNGCEGVKLSS